MVQSGGVASGSNSLTDYFLARLGLMSILLL